MPVIGFKLKSFNLPSDTLFGNSVLTVKGNSTPGTPPTDSAYVWFDASLKKWRVKYDNGTIESLGVGTSGAAAHKDSHKTGGSDPFAKGDDLDASARYLEDRSDPSSDAQRIWLQDGGSEIRYWDDQGSPVLQKLATLATAQTFSNKTFNSTCDISAVLASDTTVARLAVSNIFTAVQKLQVAAEEPLEIYRDSNTVGHLIGPLLGAKNSSSAYVPYSYLLSEIIENTAGAQTGKFHLWNKNAGTSVNNFSVSSTGRISVGPDGSNHGNITRNIIRSGALQDINTTSAEQTIFSQNILANTMGSNGILHLRIFGAILQNQATATDYTLRIKFGGTTYYQDNIATALVQSATVMPFFLDLYVVNNNATNVQRLFGTFIMNDTNTPPTGTGDISDDEGQVNGVFLNSTLNKDTTSNQTLAVTMQMSVSNAAVHTYVDYTWLEVNAS